MNRLVICSPHLCHPSLAPSSFRPFCRYPFAATTHTHTPLLHFGLGKLLFEQAYLSCLIAYLSAGCVIELLCLISCKHNRASFCIGGLLSHQPLSPIVLVWLFSNTLSAWRKDATNPHLAARLDLITAAFCRYTCCYPSIDSSSEQSIDPTGWCDNFSLEFSH